MLKWDNQPAYSFPKKVKDGIYYRPFGNGYLYLKTEIKNGKQNGFSIQYYRSPAETPEMATMVVDDMLEGIYMDFHSDGTLMCITTLGDSKIMGEYITFHENGNTKVDALYDKDIIIGSRISYHGDGSINHLAMKKNGNSHGLTISYSAITGAISAITLFIDGRTLHDHEFNLMKLNKQDILDLSIMYGISFDQRVIDILCK